MRYHSQRIRPSTSCLKPVVLPTTRLESRSRQGHRFIGTTSLDRGLRWQDDKIGTELGAYDDEEFFDSRIFKSLHIDDYKVIYEDDEDLQSRIEKILNEYEDLKYETIGQVPSNITVDDMKELLEEKDSSYARSKYFRYLFKREIDTLKDQRRKKRAKQQKLEACKERWNNLPKSDRTGLLSQDREKIVYGLWHNSLFSRLPETQIKTALSGSNLKNAALFGRKVIFDFGYEGYMNNAGLLNSVEQVQAAYGMNRYHYKEPFDLWFCNFQPDAPMAKLARKKTFHEPLEKLMISVTPDCMTNHFDKSKLVYLSPQAKEPLTQINRSDDIYIIGVFNDSGNSLPISYRKAQTLGIKSRRLPIDEYLLWKGSSKALCINHVLGLLLELMANGNDWKKAFDKHVPERKLKTLGEAMEEESIRRAKRFKLQKYKTRAIIDSLMSNEVSTSR